MADLFQDKATDWDNQPVPAQISAGVGRALLDTVALDASMRVLDFGAGTGLVCAKVAPHVGRVVAVDVSEAMLSQLRAKAELADKVDVVCQDILQTPLAGAVDLVVSAMAMHHVEDTQRLFHTFAAHLRAGGRVALADLDTEPGTFHAAGTEGVFHHGFDRAALGAMLVAAGFADPRFQTACTVTRDGRAYPIFLVTATKG